MLTLRDVLRSEDFELEGHPAEGQASRQEQVALDVVLVAVSLPLLPLRKVGEEKGNQRGQNNNSVTSHNNDRHTHTHTHILNRPVIDSTQTNIYAGLIYTHTQMCTYNKETHTHTNTYIHFTKQSHNYFSLRRTLPLPALKPKHGGSPSG